MALGWNVKSVKNMEEVCFNGPNGCMGSVTNDLIWTTMTVGIGEITEDNAVEFFLRMLLIRDIYSSTKSEGYDGVTLSDVKAHIGLKTNVKTLTRKAWTASLAKTVLLNRLRDYGYRLAEQQRAAATV